MALQCGDSHGYQVSSEVTIPTENSIFHYHGKWLKSSAQISVHEMTKSSAYDLFFRIRIIIM